MGKFNVTYRSFGAVALVAVIGSGALADAQLSPRTEQALPFPKEWIAKNAIPLRTVDPSDEDFSDLELIGRKIGNARIVMLGESSHGDGETLLAKCRLVKYLHQKKGFGVLAWESGRFEGRLADRALLAGEPGPQAVAKGVFEIWSRSTQVQPLLHYLAAQRRGPRPLEVAGFDLQVTSDAGPLELFPLLQKALDAVDPKILTPADRTMFTENREFNKRFSKWTKEDLQRQATAFGRILKEFERQRTRAREIHGAAETAFLVRLLKNYRDFVAIEANDKGRTHFPTGSLNPRDISMGENLDDLARGEYRGKKIIVWAASYHTARKVSALDRQPYDYSKTVTMGEEFARRTRERVYSITFTGYEGESGIPWGEPYAIPAASAGTFESAAAALDKPYLFFELKSAPDWFLMRSFGHLEQAGDWKRNFDAVLFTRKLTRSTEVASGAGK